MKMVGSFVGGVSLIIVGVYIRGVVLSDLWQWFVVPLFDAPPLTVLSAIGLSLVGWAFTGEHMNESSDTSFWVRALSGIIISLMAWSLGAIYYWMM